MFMLLSGDFAQNYQLSFQDPASPVFEEIILFHHYVMIYMSFVLVGVL
jgi:heme/copper-type cytochrome/quinol oxidase subunit 2